MVADRFHVSVEYIKYGEDIQWNPREQTVDYNIYLSEEEQEILTAYRNSDLLQKEMVRRLLNYAKK